MALSPCPDDEDDFVAVEVVDAKTIPRLIDPPLTALSVDANDGECDHGLVGSAHLNGQAERAEYSEYGTQHGLRAFAARSLFHTKLDASWDGLSDFCRDL